MEEDREQPSEELTTASGEAFENRVESVNGSLNEAQDLTQDNFSQPCLGKFKTPQALLDAYNNLQAEFTKKCQRLCQLEKEKIDTTNKETQIEDICNQFLSDNAEAKSYADELKNRVRSCNNLPSLNAFSDAWAGIVLDHVKKQQEGDSIVDNFLSSDNIKNKIIQNYLNSLKNSAPPMTISSSGQKVVGTQPTTPSSLKEAKSMVEKMFS